MPNKTIYLNTIKEFEKNVGFSLMDGEEIAKKLKGAWKKDTTEAKVDYLVAYREIFRDILQKWSDNEFSLAFYKRANTMPNIKECLLKTDQTLKLCAMSLIPELRENEDVLSHMTFGVIEPTNLKNEFVSVRKKYLQTKTSQNTTAKRKSDAYNKYKQEWLHTTSRKIAGLVKDKDALRLMSQDEKMDYALALEAYSNEGDPNRSLSLQEKGFVNDALQEWKKELGCANGESLEEFVAGQYYQYAQTIAKDEWVENQVNEAIAEYNKTPNPAKQEVESYKEIEAKTAVISDDVAEMVGDFFMQEELTQEIKETKEQPNRKEQIFFQDKVTTFNGEYFLNINHNKLRASVEQLSVLMIKAQEEKQRFLDKNSVVVIENGKETCYDAKDYYKEKIDEANKTCMEAIQKIEEERQLAEQEYRQLLDNIEKQAQVVDKDSFEKLKLDNEKAFKEKNARFDKELEKARADLNESLSKVKGGIVIEKNGNSEKQHESHKYYETHETKKEQYAYGQYQQTFSRIYKDACKNIKEKNYPEGKVADFSHIAKDVDELMKSAMYISNVYDNDKNIEIIQKCSFGGLSAERLASLATYIAGDDWTKEQHSETLWAKQSQKAKKILSKWDQEAKNNKKVRPGDKIKETLEDRLKKFNKGEITKKELLDYMLVGEVHMRMSYPSNFKKVFNLIQYNRARNAMLKCRSALGLTEMSSLRFAMNEEYKRMANSMSKEQIFKSVETRMNYAVGFKAEKLDFQKQHQIVQDREVARKTAELESLKAKGREPISINELDERKAILTAQPKSKPIVPDTQKQLALGTGK